MTYKKYNVKGQGSVYNNITSLKDCLCMLYIMIVYIASLTYMYMLYMYVTVIETRFTI